jgi:hypothetical protein
MTNEEGGTDPEEARWETLVDRVNTTAAVWLGSTFACAQCHNHKYDPFTQKEFYQFLAFFESSTEPKIEPHAGAAELRRACGSIARERGAPGNAPGHVPRRSDRVEAENFSNDVVIFCRSQAPPISPLPSRSWALRGSGHPRTAPR